MPAQEVRHYTIDVGALSRLYAGGMFGAYDLMDLLDNPFLPATFARPLSMFLQHSMFMRPFHRDYNSDSDGWGE